MSSDETPKIKVPKLQKGRKRRAEPGSLTEALHYEELIKRAEQPAAESEETNKQRDKKAS